MITEAITIGAILGGCAAVALIAKIKFHPQIEAALASVEVQEQTVAPRNSRPKQH